MNPSPQAVAAIRSAVTDWSGSDADVAAALNAPAVDNPAPQPTVAKPFGLSDLLPLLSAESLANIRSSPHARDIRDRIFSGDVQGIAFWAQVFLSPPPLITQSEHDAILARVTETEPDPAWPAQVGWSAIHLGRDADSHDVAAARPSG